MSFYYRMKDGRTTNDMNVFIEWMEKCGNKVSDEFREIIKTCNVDYSIYPESTDECGTPISKEGGQVNEGAK